MLLQKLLQILHVIHSETCHLEQRIRKQLIKLMHQAELILTDLRVILIN